MNQAKYAFSLTIDLDGCWFKASPETVVITTVENKTEGQYKAFSKICDISDSDNDKLFKVLKIYWLCIIYC